MRGEDPERPTILGDDPSISFRFCEVEHIKRYDRTLPRKEIEVLLRGMNFETIHVSHIGGLLDFLFENGRIAMLHTNQLTTIVSRLREHSQKGDNMVIGKILCLLYLREITAAWLNDLLRKCRFDDTVIRIAGIVGLCEGVRGVLLLDYIKDHTVLDQIKNAMFRRYLTDDQIELRLCLLGRHGTSLPWLNMMLVTTGGQVAKAKTFYELRESVVSNVLQAHSGGLRGLTFEERKIIFDELLRGDRTHDHVLVPFWDEIEIPSDFLRRIPRYCGEDEVIVFYCNIFKKFCKTKEEFDLADDFLMTCFRDVIGAFPELMGEKTCRGVLTNVTWMFDKGHPCHKKLSEYASNDLRFFLSRLLVFVKTVRIADLASLITPLSSRISIDNDDLIFDGRKFTSYDDDEAHDETEEYKVNEIVAHTPVRCQECRERLPGIGNNGIGIFKREGQLFGEFICDTCKEPEDNPVSCPVCLQDGDEGLFIVLRCNHTLCVDCVASLRDQEADHCPECRQHFDGFKVHKIGDLLTEFLGPPRDVL